jgi:hypothetical protein
MEIGIAYLRRKKKIKYRYSLRIDTIPMLEIEICKNVGAIDGIYAGPSDFLSIC